MTDVLLRTKPGPTVTAGCVRLHRWWDDGQAAAWDVQQVNRCDEILRSLAMPTPFALQNFCAELQRLRGRTLVVTAVRTRSAGAQALWCRGATTDYILVGSALPRPHRDHLALHGIGHMVFDHVGSPAVGHALRDELPETDVARLRLALKRVVYTRREERQAEVFATRVQQLAGVWTTRNNPSASDTLLLERLSSVLERRPRGAER